MKNRIKAKIAAAIIFIASVSLAETCHVPDYAGKVYFRDAVEALQCQHRKAGEQVTLLAVGKNRPVMTLEVFNKYRSLPIYDFTKSASEESPYEFDIEKMSEGDNENFTVFALSYKKIPLVKPVEQMSDEARALYYAKQAEENNQSSQSGSNGKNAANGVKTGDQYASSKQGANENNENKNAEALSGPYSVNKLIDDLARIRIKVKDINETGFDKEFIDWDLNDMIEGLKQYKFNKQLSEG